jgi:predicted MFS family arabinose efflux permease
VVLFRLLPLILGAFAIGAETFMISGVLPAIAADLRVTPATAGSLVTIFALAYAFGSPVIAVFTAGIERKRALTVALGAFAVANLLASLAPSFAWLAAARVLLALSAGLFMPSAVAFATAMYKPEQRGKAIALVYAGMTLATVIGVPLATLVADLASWRGAFLGVGGIAGLATLGVLIKLPRLEGARGAGLAERIAVARRPDALKLLGLTTLALLGPFAVNTYLGLIAETTLGVTGVALAGVLMVFGVLSFIGSQFGGYAADRWPRERYLAIVFIALLPGFGLLSLAPALGGVTGGIALFAGLAIWGVFGWSFPIVQQARLVSLDPKLASVLLSLNTSALYLGAAAGSALASATVARWSVTGVGIVAGATELLALGWLVATLAPRPAAAEPEIVACLAGEEP